MPPVPMEANIIVRQRVAILMAVSSRLKRFIARMTKTGRWMQTPSILMVAPMGREKLESALSTRRLSMALKEMGRVAAEERVTKAVSIAVRMR